MTQACPWKTKYSDVIDRTQKWGYSQPLIDLQFLSVLLGSLKPTSLLISVGNILIESPHRFCSYQSSNLPSLPSSLFFIVCNTATPEWSFHLCQQFLHALVIPDFLPLERPNLEMLITYLQYSNGSCHFPPLTILNSTKMILFGVFPSCHNFCTCSASMSCSAHLTVPVF